MLILDRIKICAPRSHHFAGAVSLRGNNAAGSLIAWPAFNPPQAVAENLSGSPGNPSCAKIFVAVPGKNGQSLLLHRI